MRGLVVVLSCLLLQGAIPAHAQVAGGSASGAFTAGAEALFWWYRDAPAPPPLITDGILGLANTQTYLGGQSLDTGMNPGVRVTLGYAPADGFGSEGSVFYVPSRSTSRSVSSSGRIGSTNLVLPYIDAVTLAETGAEISYAPMYSGSASEEYTNSFLGAEFDVAWTMQSSAARRLDVIGGLRYLRLRETYTFTTSSPYIAPYPVDIWNTTDRFETTNDFYGVQAGLRARFDEGPWFGAGTAKVALGGMVQAVDVSGSLATNDYTGYGPVQTFNGGYFALPTNIGNHSRTRFAVVPEVNLNVGFRITPATSLFVGYSFIYASNVVRPGNQINRTLNTTQSTSWTEDPAFKPTGPAQPSFDFNDSSFWAQGIRLGVAIRF